MSDRFSEFLSQLADPRLYVRKSGVTVFDEHEDRDDHGKLIRKFSKADLEKIAAECNKRDATGTLSPLTLGHTDPEEKDEEKQPAAVGYAHGYGVSFDPRLKKHVIQTCFYIRKEAYPKAKTFPRVSIELWPGKEPIIDPVALLRRTPQRDLGQWTYARGDPRAPAGQSTWDYSKRDRKLAERYYRAGTPVLRYSMESQSMADNPIPGNPWDDPMTPGVESEPEPGGDAPGPDEHVQYMKHCMGHPLAQKFAKHYAMQDQPLEGDPEGDPLLPPDATAQPLQNSAFAYPDATNTSVPPPRPQQNARRGNVNQQVRQDSAAIRLSRLESQLAEERQARAVAEARQIVAQMEYEGYQFKEPEKEVLRFARATPAQREERVQWCRDHMTPAPIQAVGRVAGGAVPQVASGGTVDLENTPQGMPLADQETVMAYRRKHNLWDDSLGEVAAKALPHKYGRETTNGQPTNGRR